MEQVLALSVSNGAPPIYPAILKDDQIMALVDCGYPGFLPCIHGAAQAKGIDLQDLTHIVITHHDFDHLGALADFKQAFPRVSIVSSSLDAPFINGTKKSLRLQQAEALFEALPENQKAEAEGFHALLRSVKSIPVDILVKDHDRFPWAGGTEILATPGHMPGHISLYVKAFKTLIAGDALVIENQQLGIANPAYTLDMEAAKQSVHKLLDYEIETLICYHGGVLHGDVKAALEGLLQ